MKSKKVSTTFTVLSMAAGMFLTPASAYAEPLASGQETVVDSSDVSTDDSVSEKTDSDSGASETPEKPEDSSSDTSKEPEEKDDSEDPAPTEPDVTPSVTPSVTPAPEPSKAPTPDASTSETKPKADSESTKKDANSSSTSTKDADPSSDNAAEAAAVEDWSQTINYENYIGKRIFVPGLPALIKCMLMQRSTQGLMSENPLPQSHVLSEPFLQKLFVMLFLIQIKNGYTSNLAMSAALSKATICSREKRH